MVHMTGKRHDVVGDLSPMGCHEVKLYERIHNKAKGRPTSGLSAHTMLPARLTARQPDFIDCQ